MSHREYDKCMHKMWTYYCLESPFFINSSGCKDSKCATVISKITLNIVYLAHIKIRYISKLMWGACSKGE